MPGKTIHAFGENGELSRGAAIALANWSLESPIGPVGPAGPVGPTGDSPAPSAAPFFVETAHLAHAVNAPSGVRAGLPATTYPDGQGFLSEHVIRVTGAAGSNVLTVDAADRATLATMVGATPNAAWGAVVAPADAPPFFTAVVATDATTVTLLRPLDRAITAAAMASRVDATGGQHLTKVATRALAWHVARFPAAIGTRGGIVEGQWDRLPASARTLWTKNAALTAYGVVNSSDGGPVIQTSLNAQPPMNPWDSEYLIARVNANTGGVRVGTHLPGHGATATLRTGRRPVVLDFWVNASRGTLPVRSIMTRTVITADGVTVLDETDTGVGRRVLQPIYSADTITVDVTLVSGGPANIDMGQLTLREAGTGTPVGGRKIVVLGDSWSQFYDKEFGKELSVATGSTVVTHGRGGMTTDWGLAWWDEYVRQERPDTVIICFFTNDLNNAVGGGTAPGPGGSTVTIWPSGLTSAQARDRWAANLRAMVALAQRDGIRPVIIGPGLVNQGTQFPGALIIETPRLVAWNATDAEVTDPASYLNTVGKTLGATVQLGGSTVVAQGPLPADPWRNPANDARPRDIYVAGVTPDNTPAANLTALQSAVDNAPDGSRLLLPAYDAAPMDVAGSVTWRPSLTLRGLGGRPVLRQMTWGAPVIDAGEGGGAFEDLSFVSGQARAALTGSYRDGSATNAAVAIWVGKHSTRRTRIARIDGTGFTAVVRATPWDMVAGAASGYLEELRIEDLRATDCDWGIVAAGLSRATITRISGTYSLRPSSPDPSHLIYVSDAKPNRAVSVSDVEAWDGTGGHAVQIKSCTGGTVSRISASNCSGVLSLRNTADMDFTAIRSLGDTSPSSYQSLYVQGGGGEARMTFRGVRLDMADPAGCPVRLDGRGCEIDGMLVTSARTAQSDLYEITAYGSGHTIRNARSVNTGSSGAYRFIGLAGTGGHDVRNPSAVGTRVVVTVSAGSDGCTIDYDPTRSSKTSDESASTLGMVVNANGADTTLAVRPAATSRTFTTGAGEQVRAFASEVTHVDVNVTGAANFILNVPYGPTHGRTITYRVANNTAAAMGAVDWVTHVLSSAWVAPAAGKAVAITFRYDASAAKWFEIGRNG